MQPTQIDRFIAGYRCSSKATLIKSNGEKMQLGSNVSLSFKQTDKFQYQVQLATEDQENYQFKLQPGLESFYELSLEENATYFHIRVSEEKMLKLKCSNDSQEDPSLIREIFCRLCFQQQNQQDCDSLQYNTHELAIFKYMKARQNAQRPHGEVPRIKDTSFVSFGSLYLKDSSAEKGFKMVEQFSTLAID
jgi:hypothetical protein